MKSSVWQLLYLEHTNDRQYSDCFMFSRKVKKTPNTEVRLIVRKKSLWNTL